MKKYLVLSVSLLGLSALLLHRFWLPWIGRFLVITDPLKKAEALVLLAGDEDARLAHGAQLFKAGYADWFVLTNMELDFPNSNGLYSQMIKSKAIQLGVPEKSILIVPGSVSTTDEEAQRLRVFVDNNGFSSLIVVTSPYHTRRARWILHQAFRDSGVSLIVQPAWTYEYNSDKWWYQPQDRQKTFLEYAKIFAHLLGYREYSDFGPNSGEWLQSWQKTDSTE